MEPATASAIALTIANGWINASLGVITAVVWAITLSQWIMSRNAATMVTSIVAGIALVLNAWGQFRMVRTNGLRDQVRQAQENIRQAREEAKIAAEGADSLHLLLRSERELRREHEGLIKELRAEVIDLRERLDLQKQPGIRAD